MDDLGLPAPSIPAPDSLTAPSASLAPPSVPDESLPLPDDDSLDIDDSDDDDLILDESDAAADDDESSGIMPPDEMLAAAATDDVGRDRDVDALRAAAAAAESKRQQVKATMAANAAADTSETRNSRTTTLDKPVDGKKDNMRKARIVQRTVISLMVAIIIIGLLNAFMPRKTLTMADVENVVATQTGNNGYPLDDAAGIAQQFVQAYILYNGTGSAAKMLNVFYNGMSSQQSAVDSPVNSEIITLNGNIAQRIEYGPIVYGRQSLASNVGDFTVGTLVYQIDTSNGNPILDANGKVKYKWLFFDVGVYYNKKSNTFAISKDSPNLTSESRTSQQNNLPDPALPGDKQENKNLVTTAMTQTLSDYMDAWAEGKQSTLANLTTNNHTPQATQGLNGMVTRDGDLIYTIYGPTKKAGDHYYRALVTVNWKDSIDDQKTISYKSQYVLYVDKTTSGKYLVYDIQPYKYYVDNALD